MESGGRVGSNRCRTNSAHIRLSGLDSGPGFRAEVFETVAKSKGLEMDFSRVSGLKWFFIASFSLGSRLYTRNHFLCIKPLTKMCNRFALYISSIYNVYDCFTMRLVSFFSLSALLSSLQMSDTQSLWAINTSPPRNRCTFLWSSCSQIESWNPTGLYPLRNPKR